jgi:hypothetical protein
LWLRDVLVGDGLGDGLVTDGLGDALTGVTFACGDWLFSDVVAAV